MTTKTEPYCLRSSGARMRENAVLCYDGSKSFSGTDSSPTQPGSRISWVTLVAVIWASKQLKGHGGGVGEAGHLSAYPGRSRLASSRLLFSPYLATQQLGTVSFSVSRIPTNKDSQLELLTSQPCLVAFSWMTTCKGHEAWGWGHVSFYLEMVLVLHRKDP